MRCVNLCMGRTRGWPPTQRVRIQCPTHKHSTGHGYSIQHPILTRVGQPDFEAMRGPSTRKPPSPYRVSQANLFQSQHRSMHSQMSRRNGRSCLTLSPGHSGQVGLETLPCRSEGYTLMTNPLHTWACASHSFRARTSWHLEFRTPIPQRLTSVCGLSVVNSDGRSPNRPGRSTHQARTSTNMTSNCALSLRIRTFQSLGWSLPGVRVFGLSLLRTRATPGNQSLQT